MHISLAVFDLVFLLRERPCENEVHCIMFYYYEYQSDEWSSQLNFQFKQLERRSLKKSRLQRDSNPWPPRYRCYALPTELWSHTLGVRSIYWVHILSCSEMMWSMYEIIHIWTAVVDESEEWSSPLTFQFKQLERRMCGFIAQLVGHRTGIAEVTGSNPVEALIFSQASSFQLLKLENLLRWSFFTFIYN